MSAIFYAHLCLRTFENKNRVRGKDDYKYGE